MAIPLQLGGPETQRALGVALAPSGEFVAVGTYSGTIDLDPGPGEDPHTGTQFAFVARLTGAGDLFDGFAIGGFPANSATDVAVSEAGIAFVSGLFQGGGDFDPGPGEAILTADLTDAWLAAYGPDNTFLFAHRIGGPGVDQGGAVATRGDVVVLGGQFSQTVDFDPGPGVATVAQGGSNPDAFIAAYGTDGAFRWAAGFTGGSTTEEVRALAVVPDGSVLAAGRFGGTVDFDPGPGVVALTAAGPNQSPFVAKLDPDGNLDWVRAFVSTGGPNGFGEAVGTDAAGNVFLAGWFHGTVDLDPGPGTDLVVSAGSSDALLAKFDPDGNLLWANVVGGTARDEIAALGVDPTGDVIVGGLFGGTVDFDPGPGTAELVYVGTPGFADGFVAKYDGTTGALDWVRHIEELGNTAALTTVADLKVGPTGAVVFTGTFGSTADFDPGAGTALLTAIGAGTSDAFVSRLDGNGNFPGDTTPPAPPVITGFSDDSGTIGDFVTNDATPTFTGTAEPNSTVTVFDGATAIGTAAVDAMGLWVFASPALADGARDVTARATDAAGNTGDPSAPFALTIDATAPTIVDVVALVPDGFYLDGAMIPIEVTFSEPVLIMGGPPLLTVDSGAPPFASNGAMGATVSFLYTVGPGDLSPDLDATVFDPAGATFMDVAGNAALLALPAPGAPGSISIDQQVVIGNTPPFFLTTVADQTTDWSTNAGPFGFTIGDDQQDPATLAVSATSSDQGVLPDGNLVLGGAGAARTILFDPITGVAGAVTVTITLTDAAGAIATDTILLTVQVPLEAIPAPEVDGMSPSETMPGGDGAGGPFVCTPGPDLFLGSEGPDEIHGCEGDDTILGNGGDDRLNGNEDDDLVIGNRGRDLVLGGQGDDTVHGGQDDDIVNGNRGDDTVNGNAGSDEARGGQGDDLVHGGQGNDGVYGDLGDDTLKGDRGDDFLTGGAGADLFCFADASGLDKILDFDALEDRIAVDLTDGRINGVAIPDLTALLARASETDEGVFLDFGGEPGNGVMVVGATLADLTPDTVLFV